MLRKIKLYGQLADFIGHKEFEIQADTVGKAVSFLIHNFPEVERYMGPKYYQVKVGNYEIDEDELTYPIGKQDIHFIPAISGAGRGFSKVLLGAALIGGAFLFTPLSTGAFFGTGAGSFAAAGYITKAAVSIGGALLLGGVSDMLFPLPEPGFSEGDPQLSFNFNGIQNTSRAGTPVPIVYGEIFTGSVVISAAVDTNQVEA
tara:strand:- start:1979 stop:2584 length:606 start_codon:yes stop_codon:yes gene_type:complete